MIKKIIATEQRSYYYDADYWYNNDDAVIDGIIIAGNSHYTSLNADLLKQVLEKTELTAADITNHLSEITQGLSDITGKTYDYSQIHGSVQGEWQYAFYPAENAFDIDYIEAVYFGTGTEYEVNGYDEDGKAVYDEPERAYQQWMPDSQRKELFKQYFHSDTLAPDVEVVIREIVGEHTTVTYDCKDR